MKNLLQKESFARAVLPYLKIEYFTDRSEKLVFEEINEFLLKYNTIPTIEAVGIAISNKTELVEEDFKKSEDLLDTIQQDKDDTNQDWLIVETEKFCKDKALYNGLNEALQIYGGDKKSTKDKGAIPKILQDALGVSFDPNVGHDYFEDAVARFEYYNRKSKKIPFNLDFFNQITDGGVEQKTLNVILAGPNVGKSLMMCDFAAGYLKQHLNVLYITLEMAEEKIAKRIDANLMDIDMNMLKSMPKALFDKKIARVKSLSRGKLVIKEYPTAGASVINFRNLLNELSLKKQFKPDVIFVDYLAICCSARLKQGVAGMYAYVKAIAEELRGLAVEFNIPVWTAAQSNRSGYVDSDPGLEHTAESFGLPATADLMFVIVTNEELAKANQLMIKQLKNRDEDVNKNRKFIIGVNRIKMQLHDVATSEQTLVDSGQETIPPPKTGLADKFGKFRHVLD